MVFSSLMFLFRFMPIAFGLYYLAPPKLKNTALFLVSLVFYSWGEVRYFPIMVVLICINYFCGLAIGRSGDNAKMRRLFLILSVIGSLGMLFFFKYIDFFIVNINAIFGTALPLFKLTLPLGISFYTFQTMSYTIDVYRRDVEIEHNIIDFGAYVVMFPQLIAGPIVKYSDIAKQLKIKEHRVSLPQIEKGVALFIFGLGKKVLIANNVGMLWTEIEAMGFAGISTPLAWLGILAYSLQIYFDFSGYSLMGIGMGYMLGFYFPDNFNLPYISRSVTEFWRRWHMTLGSWFREYVYIPLGGNRKGKARQILNIFIVWFLTGFWHGANWNFILWGLYYFALLVIEKLFLLRHLEKGKVWPHLYTLLAVALGWVLFALTGFTDIGLYLQKLFLPQGGISGWYFFCNYGLALLLGCICSTKFPLWVWGKIEEKPIIKTALLAVILILSTAYLVDSTYNPFLYFRF